jgi:hypothetical protein
MFMKKQNSKTWLQQGRDYTRQLVRERDGHTCQDCKKKWHGFGQRRFDVHHLGGMCGKKSRGYDSVNDMHTLTTLCHSCHMRTHHSTSTPKKAKLPHHREKVFAMRREGISYDKIAKKYGVSSQAVYFFINGRK